MLDAAMSSSQTSLYFEQIADCTASGVRLVASIYQLSLEPAVAMSVMVPCVCLSAQI